MHLNAEVLTMPLIQEKLPPPALRSFAPFSITVPCDFHLLNLRTLQGEVREEAKPLPASQPSLPAEQKPLGFQVVHRLSSPQDEALPSAETALILHRKGFDCGLEARNLGFNCTTTQGVVCRMCSVALEGKAPGMDVC